MFPGKGEKPMQERPKAKPKAKHGAHTYAYADLGLDDAHIRATFAAYVAHYGITEE